MRWWLKTLLTGLTLLLLLTAAAWWYLQKSLAALPLHNLQYQINSLGLRQIEFGSVSFGLDSPAMQVQLNNVSLSWQWLNSKLTRIQLGSGDISLSHWPAATPNSAPATASPLRLPENWQLPDAFPEQTDISDLSLQLPCGENRCSYLVSAALSNTAQQLQYQFTVADSNSPDTARLTLNGDYRTVQQLPLLNARLNLDNSTQLQLRQQLSAQDGINASGELTLDIAPPSPWLLQQLQLWQVAIPARVTDQALAQFSAPVSVQSNWQLQLPATTDLAAMTAQASGNWQLSANLPSPLTLPGIGQLQGTVNAELGLDQGELSRYQLDTRLALHQPQLPQQAQQYGLGAELLQINITADGQSQPQLTALPLSVSLTSLGDTALTFNADATLNLTPPFSATVQNATLALTQQQLSPATGTTIDTLTLNSRFNAYWLADHWQLDLLSTESQLAQLKTADVQARDIRLVTPSGRVSGDSSFSNVKLQAELGVSLAELRHAQLKPLSWQWQGKLSGTATALNIDGKLSNSASLGLAHQLHYTPERTRLNWQLDDMFLLAGNPLLATLTAWPALLEFNRGRLAASGELTLLPALSAQAKLSLSGVSGIYDRSLFKDLTATLQLQYLDDKLQLDTTRASLAEIQHGITAGPLVLSAQYQANSAALSSGKLDIQQLQLQAMGGQVVMQPQLLDLALAEQQLQIELQQIDISQLLQQHPTTDLTGNGRISGTIPLLLGRSGASVTDGNIAAESPGGKLQYRPPAAQSMAASNQGMKVVLEALDDFHYSVLSSNVSYDTNGKLVLALNLQGRNPALEAGRAINLNINLEEDIPALITSLQLSSQISDKIKQRVQQRLQQQGANNANGAQP
ncbi:intermembrane phospholipid transport protein YdbH family protein [Rheinheimera sp. NSM]|uniref:intermembrane phospholipid transport protein YdbH family protein n=1 Tax=Rheinheimera sp. NSM TaxID=3457884 RepID=UPI0040356824